MISLSFPDVNLWLALLHTDHPHAASALRWWKLESHVIGFCRLAQLSLLRLLTTPAVMNDRPLSMAEAWNRYDGLYRDERIKFFAEPHGIDGPLRLHSSQTSISPKLWADAYLLAFAQAAQGTLVTFDRALAGRSTNCLLLS